MASAGRRSELQALRFDQNYIQFKPKGAGVTLYFSPEFMRKNQKPNQVNDPWYIPAVPTGKSEFGAPNCPVRALRYYHRHLTEHPEKRGGRSGGPQGDSRLTDFCLWESHCVCRLGARTDRLPSLFLSDSSGDNPKCHMNYLDYL